MAVTDTQVIVAGRIHSLNLHPFNVSWLTEIEAKGAATVTHSPVASIGLEAMRVSASATVSFGPHTTTATLSYKCRAQCRDKSVKVGFIHIKQGGFIDFMKTVLGLDAGVGGVGGVGVPAAMGDMDLPSVGVSSHLTWSNYDDGAGIQAGVRVDVVATISGKLRTSLIALLPDDKKTGTDGKATNTTWGEHSKVAVSVFMPRNASWSSLRVSVSLETLVVALTPDLHLIGLRLTVTNFDKDGGFDAYLVSTVRIDLRGSVGALYALIRGDLSMTWGKNASDVSRGNWELEGRVDGAWEPAFSSGLQLRLVNPTVRIFLHNIGTDIIMDRLFMASEAMELDAAGTFAIKLRKNEVNITKFRPYVNITAQTDVTVAAGRNSHPLMMAMRGSWDGRNGHFHYDSALQNQWTPFGSSVLTIFEGSMAVDVRAPPVDKTKPTPPTATTGAGAVAAAEAVEEKRVTSIYMRGSVLGGFDGLPNASLEVEANIQSDMSEACVMLKDLPLPSLAALADLIRLPALAKGIMGDGAVEGGAASFGISSDATLACGIGRGMTAQLTVAMTKESSLVKLLSLLNPAISAGKVTTKVFLPWDLVFGVGGAGGWNTTRDVADDGDTTQVREACERRVCVRERDEREYM